MEEVLDTPYITFEIRDNLLYATYKKGVKITLEVAKKVVADRLALIKDRRYPIIILNQGVVSIDKPARDYLSSGEGIKGLTAAALILDSPFGSFLGNFMLSVTKPALVAKIFTKTDVALRWLEKYKV
jgi:hypothetical protein